MSFRSIKQIKNPADKRVLLRLDLNVPIKNGRVADDSRLKAVVPTIEFLRKKGVKIIIVSHLGRPEGKVVEHLRLDPVARRLGAILKTKIRKLDEYKGVEVAKEITEMKNGEIIMLENIRFCSDESGDKGTLAKELASLADIFVQDGFSVCHRPDASVAGVPQYLPSYAGFLVEKEIKALNAVLLKPKRPLLAIMGGAKLETKIPALQSLSKVADAILIGGGILNTLLLSLGYDVGGSLVDKDHLMIAKKLARKKNIFLPLDVVVGMRNGKYRRVVSLQKKPHKICESHEAIFDLGPATIQRLHMSILAAKTVVWNGALGFFEQKPYHKATYALAKMLAEATGRGIFTVVGGGETLEVLSALKLTDKIGYVSTAGGAMLKFLSGRKLPGLKVLE